MEAHFYALREIVKELFKFHSSGQRINLAEMKCQQNLSMRLFFCRNFRDEQSEDFTAFVVSETRQNPFRGGTTENGCTTTLQN
jgi:hypothetical protein